MSEEILKALMTLFALIVKQDGGANENEIEYVKKFLTKQLNPEAVGEYFALFLKHVKIKDTIPLDNQENLSERKKELVSVRDSVKILGVAKKISQTLDKKQKVIVLIRLFELINSDKQFTEQRMSIVDTVAKVFRIKSAELRLIDKFIISEDLENVDAAEILVIGHDVNLDANHKAIQTEQFDGKVYVLKVKSVDLYFIKYIGNHSIFLNGLALKNDTIYILAYGSTIKLPKGKPIYYSDIVDSFIEETEQKNISFNVRNLEYKFKSGKIGLNDVNISEKQGRLVGILGASGAGKTTLFNVLSGINTPSKGQVLINGIDLHKNKKELEGIIGYIPQDDLLIEELSVFKNLFYNAKLCFKEKSNEEITDLVNLTLNSLGLQEIAHLKVGSPLNKTISGGQRKRLNIALELIREPSILFVDEPTSGLSSQDSENVMNLLRELVLKGKLVFVVIHQPSSDIFKMFDNVIIMDTGGHMVYYGNPVESVIYFKKKDAQIESDVGECIECGNINPELIFNILETKIIDDYGNYTDKRKVSSKIWANYYNNESKVEYFKDETEKPKRSSWAPGWFKQSYIFFLRDFFSKISNKQYVLLNLIEAPLLGFVLAYLIKFIADPNSKTYIFRENENIPQYIFMTIIVALFLGLIISAEEIFKDRKILKREKFLNLSRSGYLISKILILVSFSAVQAILFVLVGNIILEIKGMLFEYWLAFFTTAVFANMLGLNISASFNSAVTIYILIPLLMIPQMILGGAMFSFDKLNRTVGSVDKVPIVAEMITSKWIYEGLLVHQFKNNNFEQIFYEYEKQQSIADFKQVYLIPELLGKLDEAKQLINSVNDVDKQTLTNKLKLLSNEIIKEQNVNQFFSEYEQLDKLNLENFTEEIATSLEIYLEQLMNYYKGVFNESFLQIENIIKYMHETEAQLYIKKRNMFHNDALADIVKKVYEKNKILEYDNHFIQNVDPIYRDADNNGYIGIRSHFLSPNKYFMGAYYDTYWFNIIMVWIMSVIMYFTLYFEHLKKLMNINFLFFIKNKG